MFSLDNIGGVPAHPLLVHIPVVLIPVALILAIAAFWPRIRKPMIIAAACTAAIGGIGVLLAAGSGESLEGGVRSQVDKQLLHDHTEKGDAAQAPAVIFGVIAVGAAAEELWRRRRNGDSKFPKWVPAALLGATVLSGAVATKYVYEAGHSGAKSVWHGVTAVGEGGGEKGDD